jgi:hypothetical protein
MHDGIVVHGLWSIDVKNSDGTVAAHREFENSLVSTGSGLLNSLLQGETVVGGWYLSVCTAAASLATASSACETSPGVLFVEPGGPGSSATTGGWFDNGCTAANSCYPVLSTPTITSAGTLTTTGTATLPQNSPAYTLTVVQSYPEFCYTVLTANAPPTFQAPNSTFTPASCSSSTAGEPAGGVGNTALPLLLTGAPIQPSVTVNPGQSITVTFNLTFTSAS